MINKEFFLALDSLEKEMKVDKETLIQSLETGLAIAYKRETGEPRAITVKLNPEKNTIKYFAYYTVVEGETDADSELTLEEALDRNPKSKVGDIIGEDITPKTLSRIAAQTAKQVIMQRFNDIKKEQVKAEMSAKEGEIMNAIVRRVDSMSVYLEIIGSQMEGVMGLQDQVPGERYEISDRFKVYVKKVKANPKVSQVAVSRTASNFVKKLFELEVPELKSGLIKVVNIVREAGYRTKIAVTTDDSSIDAVGACIGPKGGRVNVVVSELNGEKIDVIPYCADPSEYVARALSPAKVLMVKYDESENMARVIVPDDKLSLAIGKAGLNTRLASKLTGLKIDIKPYSKVVSTEDLDLINGN